ncbi:MAG: protein-L-isoaspartate(D-aspartate) O-methyltransferase [bacterium]
MNRQIVLFFILVLMNSAFCQRLPKEDDAMNQKSSDAYAEKRRRMVEEQIKARGVSAPLVLEAMMKVKRHRFVPDNLFKAAYYDEPLPIGCEQTISQPYIVAYMTEALDLKGNEKVLEIGTGSGYQAAVLAEIVKEVYTVEIVESLSKTAAELLEKEGYRNVFCRFGDGYKGWPEEAPFDAIIVTAAPPSIPQPLIDQLKDGGRMVVPVGTWFQELVLVTKMKGRVEKKRLIPVWFVPMTGEIQNKKEK